MRILIPALTFSLATSVFAQTPAPAPQMPADYAAVLQTLGRQGDFKDDVLKVNIPRNDLKVVGRRRGHADAVRFRRMGRADQGRPAGWTS